MDDWSPPEPDVIPEELVEFVKSELHPGERLVWASVSKPRPWLGRPTGLRSLLKAIASFGLSGLLYYLIFGPSRPRFLPWENLILGLALALDLAGLVGLFVALYACSAYQAERTEVPRMTYALSDRRAVIWSPIVGTQAVQVVSVVSKSIKKLHRIEYPDGSGDVRFQQIYNQPEGFSDIDEVRRVENLIRRYLIASDPSSTS